MVTRTKKLVMSLWRVPSVGVRRLEDARTCCWTKESGAVDEAKVDNQCAGLKNTTAVVGIKDPSSGPLRNRSVCHNRAKQDYICSQGMTTHIHAEPCSMRS